MADVFGWHVELTTRCILACPGCSRTQHLDIIPNLKKDIDKELLFRFMEQVTERKYMLFWGNLGDPIYHPDFLEIVEWFSKNKWQEIQISTNGVHSKQFWEHAISNWPENVTLKLSIDGLEDTNHIYRVNSKWNKIQELFDIIATTKRKCRIEWKYIIFEHNKHQVDQAVELSKKIGIDDFSLKSSRPLDDSMNLGGTIKEVHLKEYFIYDTRIDQMANTYDVLDPYCQKNDMHYIDANGNYQPCCMWKEDSNTGHSFWNNINIRDNGPKQFKKYFGEFSDKHLENGITNAPPTCQQQCKKVMNRKEDELSGPNCSINRVFL